MGKEIERKFLVDAKNLEFLKGVEPTEISQGYLSKERLATVRVRIAGVKSYLTIKGPATGLVCDEFEYEIPLSDAKEMLQNNCDGGVISKMRYEIPVDDFIFEVDVFGGKLRGLVVAEVEIPSEDTEITLPTWAGKEVSLDFRYKNSFLASAEAAPVC